MHLLLLAALALDLHNVESKNVKWKGRDAVQLMETASAAVSEAIAILKDTDFQDGVIETEIAGLPKAGAREGSRGFVGIAFRVQGQGEKFECFYLRPTNGRADDQLRRNHATQYISHPDWQWQRLRKEVPGVYESYTDVVPGEWTKIRIEVDGTKARLYVNGAKQPTLIVNDLKHGVSRGAIALWIGQDTEAYFSEVKVSER